MGSEQNIKQLLLQKEKERQKMLEVKWVCDSAELQKQENQRCPNSRVVASVVKYKQARYNEHLLVDDVYSHLLGGAS